MTDHPDSHPPSRGLRFTTDISAGQLIQAVILAFGA